MSASLADFDRPAVAAMFDFLDDLRESGETNMFGAGPYVEREFDLSRDEAKVVTLAWMKTFSHDEDADQRAGNALAGV